ncbi:MAG TPA: hypothetical protein VKG43_04905 [Acidimicrobiales bacterium]|nr:hypothetical protein [Acidimicrobiales bacterium]
MTTGTDVQAAPAAGPDRPSLGPARSPFAPAPRRRPTATVLPALATAVAVVGVIAVVLSQLHPGLLVSNTTTTGGDTGAHYVMPAYLATLISHGHLTGWDPGWYDGFPIYTYYFVLPDALVALAHLAHLPYGIAFKWATLLGSVSLPVCAWACGRLFRLRAPGPALLAVATLPFLFDPSYTIYGGNLFSTLAGEYAYSLSLSLAVLFLGLMASGLRTGRHRGWTAVVLAACIASHIVPAAYALVGAVVLTAFELLPERWRPAEAGFGRGEAEPWPVGRTAVRSTLGVLWWAVSTVGIGLALSAWWLVPFAIRQPYATSMGYENVTTYASLLLPEADAWALVLAAVALAVAVVRRSRFGLLVAILGGAAALAVVVDPQGSLYNVRLVPLWLLSVFLMAGWVVGVGLGAGAHAWRRYRQNRWSADVRRAWGTGGPLPARPATARWAPGAVAGPLVGLLAALVVVVPPFILPAQALPVTPGANQVTNWAAWNYAGYEGTGAYGEFQAVMHTMAMVGAEHGCGRAMWEYEPNLDRFGTPMALMLLPYETGGCIDSMEGLLFESSATTPYHFINQSELSVQPSEPVVGLPYSGQNVALGVRHLQLLGVRYFMASDPAIQAAAATDPSLRLVATTGRLRSLVGSAPVWTIWDVYQVADSALVTPLSYRPAVVQGVGSSQKSWLPPSLAWYDDPARWPVELTAGGPADWPRTTVLGRSPKERVRPTAVTDITTSDQSISFHVSRVGTPVLVKVSYFPNWQATGAQGPWRATPNLMVVVPTSHDVTLRYATSHADEIGTLLTLAGVAALVASSVVARRARGRRGARRRGASGPGPSGAFTRTD